MVLAAVLWKPALLPHGVALNLGDYEPQRLPLAGLIAATALAVALAAMQRKADEISDEARPARAPRSVPPEGDGPVELAAVPEHDPAPFPFSPFTPSEPAVAVAVAAVESRPTPLTPLFTSAERAAAAPALEPLPDPKYPEPAIAVAPLPEPRYPEPVTAAAPAPEGKVLQFRLPDPELPSSPRPASGASRRQFLALTEAGDDYRMQGRSDDAMEHYTTALDLARDAHSTMPDNAEAIGDLAAALTNVGDVYSEQGRLDAALDSHEESLRLRRALALRSPKDKGAQRGLSLGLERLADTREARGHRTRALDLYRESLPIAERLAAQYPHDALLSKDLAITRENIAQLEAKLA